MAEIFGTQHADAMSIPAIPAINFLAVVVAGIVSFVLGGIWYAPSLFGNTWMNLIGKKREEIGKADQVGGSFIATLILAFVLAIFINYAGAKSALDGAEIGLWTWIGFQATVGAASTLYERRPMKLFFINGAYQLIGLLIMGAIIGAWI